MIRIIKEGAIINGITFECSNCGCVFETNEYEVVDYINYQGIQFEHQVRCGCPNCGIECIEYVVE